MKSSKSVAKHGYKFEPISPCCPALAAIMKVKYDRLGDSFYVTLRELYPIHYCPFCGEKVKIKEVDEKKYTKGADFMTQEGIDQIRLAKVVEELKQIENAILKGGEVDELIKRRDTLLNKKKYYEATAN